LCISISLIEVCQMLTNLLFCLLLKISSRETHAPPNPVLKALFYNRLPSTTRENKLKYIPQETLKIYQESYIKSPTAATAATATLKEEDKDMEKWPV
jgi:hypothetical protein